MNRRIIVGVLILLLPAGASSSEPVPRARLSAPELTKNIDRHILERLQAAGIQPAERCSDAAFLRRAALDIVGVIPTASKVTAFLESTQVDRRERLIEELLADPRHGRRQADIWLKLLVQKEGNNTRVLAFQPLHDWLAERFHKNQPWDALVRDLLTASGTQNENPAATFFLAGPAPDRVTDKVSLLFLGVRLECAQCHDHPFTDWKQADYWGLASFFGGLRYEGPRITNPTAVRELGPGKPYPAPESFQKSAPRFLRGEPARAKGEEPLRPILARWLTAAENPYFARAMVNRVWAQFFGKGLVQPVDDMTEENEPSHPELLDLLTEQFIANGFDLKYLTRAICNSDAYQRSASISGGKGERESHEDSLALFGRMSVRVLAPEQLYDSLVSVVGAGGRIGRPGGPRFSTQRDNFVEFFRAEGEEDATDYRAGIPQALRLMNGDAVSMRAPLLKEVVSLAPEKGVERLFLAALSRPPTAAERERYSQLVRESRNVSQGYAALLWALVNCSEFVLNH